MKVKKMILGVAAMAVIGMGVFSSCQKEKQVSSLQKSKEVSFYDMEGNKLPATSEYKELANILQNILSDAKYQDAAIVDDKELADKLEKILVESNYQGEAQ